MKCYVLITLLFFQGFNLIAQDFSYFTLGKEELNSAEIYSILPTNDGKLFVSTDIGFYEYVSGKMRQVSVSESTNLQGPLFNLIQNSKNDVFGSDLLGNIYNIKSDSISLFFEMPKKYLGSDIYLCTDEDDSILVASNGCISIDNSKFTELYYNERDQANGLSKKPNGDIILSFAKKDSIAYVKDKSINYLPRKIGGDFSKKNIFVLSGSLFTVGNNANQILSITDGKLYPYNTINRFIDYEQYNEKEVWVRHPDKGLSILQFKNDNFKVSNLKLTDYFISDVVSAIDGTIYVGTFGEGVLVIPNQNVIHHRLNFTSSKLIDIEVAEDNTLYVLDRFNGLYNYKKNETKQLLGTSLRRDRIFYHPNYTSGSLPGAPSLYFQGENPGGAEKDISIINKDAYLIASSVGIKLYGHYEPFANDIWVIPDKSFDYRTFKKLKERCVAIAFNTYDSSFFVATLSEVYKVTKNGGIFPITYKSKKIRANQLLIKNNELWIATRDNGLLVSKTPNVKSSLVKYAGLQSDYIKQIQFQENKLFISHNEGFQIINLNNQEITSFGRADGIVNKVMKDFTVNKKHLWFISDNKLLSLNIDSLKKKTPNINLELAKVLVENKHRKFQDSIFNNNENDFTFIPLFRGLLFEKEARIQYRLLGLQDNWNELPATTGRIEFNYLPSGSYTLQLRAIFQDYRTPIIKYSFRVKEVFWKTTWFILGISVLTLGLFLYLIRVRNARIHRRNMQKIEKQTLKAEAVKSELKALKAQMNPHFIFNSLNAIQDLILQKETKPSYNYIELFASLIRRALVFSEKTYIAVEEELDFLDTYLKLAQLRFDEENFEYTFNCEVPLDQKIPTLLLQPFVENALNHGLFHKTGFKNIKIHIYNEGSMYCIIEDNGIGRKASSEILKRQKSGHQSFAMAAIKKRLEMLSEKENTTAIYRVEDLQENNRYSGTRITIQLPII
ncbi:histidine kinase [uncultured Croceitalea sp.]|uniref:sensor histidine kinase n=1 Tax=uncultured Croceitalea sp. TaxID=1798908 RepID=UPI00330624DE